MEKSVHVKICEATRVRIGHETFSTVTEVADVLRPLIANDPETIVSIDADKSEYYEAIGIAVYAAHRAGVAENALRFVVAGKLVER